MPRRHVTQTVLDSPLNPTWEPDGTSYGFVISAAGIGRVIDKPFPDPRYTAALNRARKACGPDETYGAVGASSFEQARVNLAHQHGIEVQAAPA